MHYLLIQFYAFRGPYHTSPVSAIGCSAHDAHKRCTTTYMCLVAKESYNLCYTLYHINVVNGFLLNGSLVQ